MSLEHFLRAISGALVAERIPAMLTGSVAAALRGASRATMDVDIVIQPTREALDRFVERTIELGYYASLDAAREAFASQGLFNVIDAESGWKADLIIRKARPFSEAEFDRRESLTYHDISIPVARLEDLVVAKLEWATLGASARQLEDVRTLLRIGGSNVDREYVERWVRELKLEEEWEKVRRQLMND